MAQSTRTNHMNAYRLVRRVGNSVAYYGPYKTVSAAKARRTELTRWQRPDNGYTYTIEELAGEWQEV